MSEIKTDKEDYENVTQSENLTLDEARLIAFEALRALGTPGWEHIKDLIGRELDITDETIDCAIGLLFSEKNNDKDLMQNELGTKPITLTSLSSPNEDSISKMV